MFVEKSGAKYLEPNISLRHKKTEKMLSKRLLKENNYLLEKPKKKRSRF